MIDRGEADIMIVGGSEFPINMSGMGGFCALKALSTREDFQTASRPWDVDRDGFVVGEGAGVLILEEFEHAKKSEKQSRDIVDMIAVLLEHPDLDVNAGAYSALWVAVNESMRRGSNPRVLQMLLDVDGIDVNLRTESKPRFTVLRSLRAQEPSAHRDRDIAMLLAAGATE